MSTRQRTEATKPGARTAGRADGVTVTWRKTTFRLPRAEDFPLEATELEEQGKHLGALRLILGDEQYASWRTQATTLADVEDFSSTVMAVVGKGNR